jgi:hypothetical protein
VTGWSSGVRFPAGAWIFFFFFAIASRLAQEPHSVSCLMNTEVSRSLFPEVKRSGREVDPSPLSSTEIVELYLYSPKRLDDVVLSEAQGHLYLYMYPYSSQVMNLWAPVSCAGTRNISEQCQGYGVSIAVISCAGSFPFPLQFDYVT